MIERTTSAQEFADKAHSFGTRRVEGLGRNMPDSVIELANRTRTEVRGSLNLGHDQTVVIFGEQTYGLNESPKVLGKRLLAKHLEEAHDITPVELFACNDVAGSEAGIYRMQLPHPNSPEGHIAVNTLPGWKHGKNRATMAFSAPTSADLNPAFATLTALYGTVKAENYRQLVNNQLTSAPNYAMGNADLLREVELQIGLGINRSVGENTLDTQIAQSGGMQLMLNVWPKIVESAQEHPTEGVRVPTVRETPFYIYHQDGGCMGRMSSVFDTEKQELGMETPVTCQCLHCGGTETTTCSKILADHRPLTWRAIPRVIAYSNIFDAHITGGGSVYNRTAQPAAEKTGLPYFPITHMNPSGERRQGIFDYQSSAINGKGPHRPIAEGFVQEGKAAMADLLLSVGADQLREAIHKTLSTSLDTASRVMCPPPAPKHMEIIRV